jgi:hypothetical protein
MTTAISPQQLAESHATGDAIDLIDVRTPGEFREVHVPFAKKMCHSTGLSPVTLPPLVESRWASPCT